MLKNVFELLLVFSVMFVFSNLSAAEIHCNHKTKVCHKENSKHYNCKECTKIFQSEDEAVKNGYRMSKQEKSKEEKKKDKK